jgi:hypothetical protein
VPLEGGSRDGSDPAVLHPAPRWPHPALTGAAAGIHALLGAGVSLAARASLSNRPSWRRMERPSMNPSGWPSLWSAHLISSTDAAPPDLAIWKARSRTVTLRSIAKTTTAGLRRFHAIDRPLGKHSGQIEERAYRAGQSVKGVLGAASCPRRASRFLRDADSSQFILSSPNPRYAGEGSNGTARASCACATVTPREKQSSKQHAHDSCNSSLIFWAMPLRLAQKCVKISTQQRARGRLSRGLPHPHPHAIIANSHRRKALTANADYQGQNASTPQPDCRATSRKLMSRPNGSGRNGSLRRSTPWQRRGKLPLEEGPQRCEQACSCPGGRRYVNSMGWDRMILTGA